MPRSTRRGGSSGERATSEVVGAPDYRRTTVATNGRINQALHSSARSTDRAPKSNELLSESNKFHAECNQFHPECNEFHAETNEFHSRCNQFDAECSEFHS